MNCFGFLITVSCTVSGLGLGPILPEYKLIQKKKKKELEEYKFELVHIKGRENRRADTLSRWPSYDQGEEDNKGVCGTT